MSRDGQFLAFSSYADNLVSGDNNGTRDVFVFDRITGVISRESVSTGSGQATGDSGRVTWFAPAGVAISADGRYVAFEFDADDLVAGDSNGVRDVFVRDRSADTTVRVSVTSNGFQVYGKSKSPSLSDDGCSVAFSSEASGLVPGDTNGTPTSS